jgi:hypothetical protein
MKRRGMYCSGSFFKPFTAPTAPYSLNRLNSDSLETPSYKRRVEYGLFDRNNDRKEDKDLFVKASNEV